MQDGFGMSNGKFYAYKSSPHRGSNDAVSRFATVSFFVTFALPEA